MLRRANDSRKAAKLAWTDGKSIFDSTTICGRALPRATGQPKAPIPESEMCPDCDAQG